MAQSGEFQRRLGLTQTQTQLAEAASLHLGAAFKI